MLLCLFSFFILNLNSNVIKINLDTFMIFTSKLIFWRTRRNERGKESREETIPIKSICFSTIIHMSLCPQWYLFLMSTAQREIQLKLSLMLKYGNNVLLFPKETNYVTWPMFAPCEVLMASTLSVHGFILLSSY